MSDYINQPYLRSEHLLREGKYASPQLKIVDVLHNAPLMRKNKTYQGLALVFEKQEKVLGLGVTNESLLAIVCGDSAPDKWIGHTIRLEVREVQSVSGGTEPAIRIIPESGTKLRSGLVRQLGKVMK